MSLTQTSTKSCRLGYTILKGSLRTRQPRDYSTNSSPGVIESDVVIVGGGPAGLALASALGSSPSVRGNISVTLVEGSDLSKIKSWSPAPGTFSNRVSSLTNESQAFLKDIGAWSHVDGKRTCVVDQMHVWDGVSDARINFSSEDVETSGYGMAHLTENLNLQRGLLRHLEAIPEVKIMQQTKVVSIDQDHKDKGGWPLVHLDNNTVLRARLLVGADGFNSPVRSYAGISSYGWAYNTQAIVATMIHPPRGAFEGPNTTAYQRFLPTGPIAFLPMAPTHSSLVWSTKPALAAALLACDPAVLSSMINAAFRLPDVSMKYLHKRIMDAHTAKTFITPEEIQQEIRWREQAHGIDQNSAHSSSLIDPRAKLGIPPSDSESVPPLVTTLQPGSMASFPLRFNHAESYTGEGRGARTVLVGDAAHTVHPLAGQGLNLGLADVECLAECIQSSLLAGGDIGSHTALLPYGQKRYLANHTMMSAVDKLHKIYSTDNDAIVWARSVGMEVLNELDSVKAAIMMRAGAQSVGGRASGWNFAGNAVEAMASTVHAAGIAKGVLGNVLGSTLKNLAGKIN
ncbi:ubiquinone biosynthesis hydrox [Crassisporium funariophilum]|nr:ubiquinone biosynthesis hydrox [Crassisporium funariophilum]